MPSICKHRIIERAVSNILNLCSIGSIGVRSSGPRFQGPFFKSPAVCTEN